MTKAQQAKIYKAMTKAQKSRIADLMMTGLSKNTAISAVVMQDMLESKLAAKMVVYSSSQASN